MTFNLRDFPAAATEPLGVTAIHPDEFLLDQLDLAPRVMLDVLREQAADTRNPPLRVVDVVARLERAGVPEFAAEADRML